MARRGITTVIPQKKDEIAARKRRGSAGGRPPALDTETYKGHNVVERHFALAKQWRGLATRYDKLGHHLPRCRRPQRLHHLVTSIGRLALEGPIAWAPAPWPLPAVCAFQAL